MILDEEYKRGRGILVIETALPTKAHPPILSVASQCDNIQIKNTNILSMESHTANIQINKYKYTKTQLQIYKYTNKQSYLWHHTQDKQGGQWGKPGHVLTSCCPNTQIHKYTNT